MTTKPIVLLVTFIVENSPEVEQTVYLFPPDTTLEAAKAHITKRSSIWTPSRIEIFTPNMTAMEEKP